MSIAYTSISSISTLMLVACLALIRSIVLVLSSSLSMPFHLMRLGILPCEGNTVQPFFIMLLAITSKDIYKSPMYIGLVKPLS